MSNYAALIGPLSICGSLKTDGTPNVNGIVWFCSPGTTTPVTVYADAAATDAVTAPVTLDVGGRLPYADYPNGIYTKQPIRLLIQDSTGLTVSDTTFESSAGATGLSNVGFPNETTVDQAFTALYASLGGIDGQFSPFVGATPLPLYKVISGIQLTPQMFGAKGDGLNDDTNAIQAMLNKLVALHGGVGFFPPGTYKISAVLTIPAAASGIALIGAGQGATTITQSSTADVFASSSAADISMSGMTINGNVGLTSVARCSIRSVIINRGNSTSTYGLSLASCSIVALDDCIITGASSGAQWVLLSGTTSDVYFARCGLGSGIAASICIDISGAASNVFAYGTRFIGPGGTTGVKYESGATGTGLFLSDCPTLGALSTPIDASAISSDPGIIQRNCGLENVTSNITSGGPTTFTPSSVPNSITANCNVNGAGGTVTVAAPTPALGTNTPVGRLFEYQFNNVNGNAVTWNMNAIFKTTASVDGTDTHKTVVGFRWDGTNLRERYRAQTT